MHPDVQAQMILSFQEERMREAEARRREGWSDDNPSWLSRLLNSSGDALINTGNMLKRHADDDMAQPATNGA